ncbi:hypothetical protein EJB05_47282, partial [Eragrostis curvula]
MPQLYGRPMAGRGSSSIFLDLEQRRRRGGAGIGEARLRWISQGEKRRHWGSRRGRIGKWGSLGGRWTRAEARRIGKGSR